MKAAIVFLSCVGFLLVLWAERLPGQESPTGEIACLLYLIAFVLWAIYLWKVFRRKKKASLSACLIAPVSMLLAIPIVMTDYVFDLAFDFYEPSFIEMVETIRDDPSVTAEYPDRWVGVFKIKNIKKDAGIVYFKFHGSVGQLFLNYGLAYIPDDERGTNLPDLDEGLWKCHYKGRWYMYYTIHK